MRETTKP